MVQTYNLPAANFGNTFDDVQFTLTLNGSPVDLTGATIKMAVMDQANGPRIPVLDSSKGGFVISNPTGGVFQTAVGIVLLSPKKYNYDIKITLSNGEVKTWISGTWLINPVITE